MKFFSAFLFLFLAVTVSKCLAQGCQINNYNGFNRVFNAPSSFGSRTFLPGNGRNYVRWEGVCGPHTYVSTIGSPNGSCTVTESGITRTGDYYNSVSAPFTSPCPVPIDDYVWVMILLTGGLCYTVIKKNQDITNQATSNDKAA